MVESFIARPSKSASSLYMTLKKDNAWRPCGDNRSLNAWALIPSAILMILLSTSRAQVFSTLDLVKAYHQIPVHEDDLLKTVIITPFALFEFFFMNFGLRNAGQTFQRFIDDVTRVLDFCFPYVEDIHVYSADETLHRKHLRILFWRFQDYGVVNYAFKYVLGAREVTFLDRVQIILDFSYSKIVQGVRRFLGMLNYYRRFVPHTTQFQAPLIDTVVATNSKGAKPLKNLNSVNGAYLRQLCFNIHLMTHTFDCSRTHPLRMWVPVFNKRSTVTGPLLPF